MRTLCTPHSARLAEETDLRAASWHALTDYFSSPGATSEAGRVYLARDLSELPRQERTERTEEEAEMTYRWVPLQDAVQLRSWTVKCTTRWPSRRFWPTYAASARGFEGLREAAGGWEFHPYMGHRRQKPQTFR